MMKRLLLVAAAVLGLSAPAVAQTRALPPGEIRANGDITFGSALKLGKRQGSKTIITPDALQILGAGSTGDVSAMTVDGTALASALGAKAPLVNPAFPRTAGTWSDDVTPGAFGRFGGRLLVGDAALWTGAQYSGYSPAGAYASYLQRDSQAYISSNIGLIGFTASTRSSDQPSNIAGPRAPIGIAGLLVNDKVGLATGAWAGYLDYVRKQSTSTTYGLEIAAKNQGTDSVTPTPYSLQGSGSAIGLWFAGGGDPTYGGAPAAPSSAAITIGKNGSTWDKGVVFGANGLTGNDGVTAGQISTAIEFGMGQRLVWRNSDDTQRNAIWAEVDPVGGGGRFGLKFGLLKGEMMGNGNVPVARFISTIAPVNLPVFVSANTGAVPQLHWTGSDANITGLYATQGTGSHLFRTGGVFSVDRLTSGTTTQAEVKHTAGATDWPILTGAAGAATIGVGGSSPNANVVVTGKGTGGVVLRDGGSSLRVQANTTGVGFNAATPIAKCSLAAALPTDGTASNTALATALNTQRACLINYGLAQ